MKYIKELLNYIVATIMVLMLIDVLAFNGKNTISLLDATSNTGLVMTLPLSATFYFLYELWFKEKEVKNDGDLATDDLSSRNCSSSYLYHEND